MRVTLLGSSGTIGAATERALRLAGHDVRCPGRSFYRNIDLSGTDAVISCLASRTGTPKDAWAVDYKLNSRALLAAKSAGVSRFVLLSAICVQKPRLAFQRAKLAFEGELQTSGLTWSIVRPTAYFKSLSGQMDRLRGGKPFLVFGDGTLTACKPISDADLATYLVACLINPDQQNRVLPIGGPGPALTPNDLAQMMSDALGIKLRIRNVPPGFLKLVASVLGALPGLKEKAALAQIGHYYATESMLVWDGTRYNAGMTPEFGSDTIRDHFRALASGEIVDDRGAHAVF